MHAVLADAIADSALFVMEEDICDALLLICGTYGFGIQKKMEVQKDLSVLEYREIIEKAISKEGMEVFDDGQIVDIKLTIGAMLSPVQFICICMKFQKTHIYLERGMTAKPAVIWSVSGEMTEVNGKWKKMEKGYP